MRLKGSPVNWPLPVLGTFGETPSLKVKSSRETLYALEAPTTPLLGLPAIKGFEVYRFLGEVGYLLDDIVPLAIAT